MSVHALMNKWKTDIVSDTVTLFFYLFFPLFSIWKIEGEREKKSSFFLFHFMHLLTWVGERKMCVSWWKRKRNKWEKNSMQWNDTLITNVLSIVNEFESTRISVCLSSATIEITEEKTRNNHLVKSRCNESIFSRLSRKRHIRA